MTVSPRCRLQRTAGLPAVGADEFDDLLLRRGSQVQAGTAEPADHSRQSAKPVVLGSWDDRDRETAAMDDRPDPALGDLFDQSRKRGPGI